MITEFPQGIHDKLKYYVYLYIDPRNNEVFYVGKGQKNRVFAHLKEKSDKEKVMRIKEIQNDGFEPRIEILVHQLDDETAKRVEASVIDLLGLDKLSNLSRGYESRTYGRMSVDQIIAIYSADKVEIDDECILINISRTFRYGMTNIELYDATRSAWVIGNRKEKAKYAIAVYQGTAQEIYEIAGWFKNNSTMNTRKIEERDMEDERWEFVGQIANNSVRMKYLYKDVSAYVGTQNPIRYINC